MIFREQTKVISIGEKKIGGGNPILIQSMTNTRTYDADSTIRQILELEEEGCDIIRVTVPTKEDAEAIPEIKRNIHIPLVADIHFDPEMAILAMQNGADKIRINPGNVGGMENLKRIVKVAKERNIPIRVGVNGGSLEKNILAKYGHVTPQGIVESAWDKIRIIENCDYDNIVVSIKSSNVLLGYEAHKLLAQTCPYPLHVGVTEAGTLLSGNIKSAIGISMILNEGIGDTIRVSLTGNPIEEVKSGKLILKNLNLKTGGIEVISCPTCGRTKIDIISLASRVETIAGKYPNLNLKLAVMGCVVNGPGEAKEADLGICGGDKEALLIKKGEIIKKIPESEILAVLENELANWS